MDKKPAQGVWLIDAPSSSHWQRQRAQSVLSSAAAGFAFCKLEGFVNELRGFGSLNREPGVKM